ncbi:SGNH/GDSL hydrolase family protein [Acetobacter sp.]|jgi:lysophospholipase L1-like esterase|uniref:SGNH/GDSL hydrolase family protein n=1 Tax=Acetobacter sp. TaxID=440 RepID=UPI0025C66E0F|nr:SGNH/GDSL hydrolase family protein [Acetobacter sp.]MCH4091724.1 hypothetical protein [Acetobacter sp.]MCI1300419.1 hypothetical protein [Acetobacter sp.]MCI1316762.1 hypothetical protein [Acetobacter sp.]
MVTWTQLADTNVAATASAVAAGQTLVDGWIDLVGNVWSTTVLPSGATQNYLTSIKESTPWSGGPLYRPQSEDAMSGRMTAQVRLNSSQTVYVMLRSNRGTAATAFQGYLLGIDNNSSGFFLHGFVGISGKVTQVLNQTLSQQPANGDLVTLDVQLTQDTSTTSTLVATVTNSAGVTLGTATVTGNSTVNTAALQNIVGSFGLCAYSANSNNVTGVKEVSVYSGDAAATAATAYTLSGSSSLTVNTAATYTVTPNGAPAAAVTIMPVSTLAGTFSPTTVTLPAASTGGVPFTFTPSVSGSGSLSTTNSGSLTNPAALSLTVGAQATAPSAPSFTLAAGSGQVTVTVAAPTSTGGATITGYPIFVGTSAGGESSSPVTTLTAPGTYTITGLTNGVPVYVTVGATNSVGTTRASEKTATPVAPAATTYTLSGSSSLAVNTPATYTVAPNAAPSSAVTITPASTLAGTFSPATVTLAAGSASGVTFTFTPSAVGSGSLSTTNSGSLTNPAALSLTVISQATAPSAPSFTLAAGSGQVTVTVAAPTSTGGATITGYPIFVGTSAGGESSSPVTTLTAPGTYTITGLTNGVPVYVTVGATNSVGTTQAVEQTAIPVAPVTGGAIAVDSPAFLFSPGNWYGDTGRAGSAWRRTWNVGAYFVLTWTASASPTATLHLGPSGTGAYVTLYLNGVGTTVAVTGDITLSGITPSSENVLFAILSNTPQSSRWNQGGNNLVVSGVTVDSNSSAGVSVAGTKGWIKIIGDSITEGIKANNNKDNIVYGYTFQVLQGLRAKGYEVCVSACGYSGYLVSGDSSADVPPYYYVSGSSSGSGGTYDDSKSRWNKIDANVSALDSNNHLSAYGAVGTEPAAIVVNYLTNEALSKFSTSDSQAAMRQAMTAHRQAAPDAWLFQIVPFGFHYTPKYAASWLAVFNNAMNDYRAAYPGDTRVATVDIGSDLSNTLQKNMGWYIYTDDVHPLAPGHALVAPVVQASIVTSMESKRNQSYTFF